MIEEARVPSFPLGHLVLVIRSVRIDGAHEVRPTMPSSAVCSRSIPGACGHSGMRYVFFFPSFAESLLWNLMYDF